MSFSKQIKSSLGIGFILFAMISAPQTWAQEFNEDFENGIPNDWGLFQDGEATQNWETTTDGYESDGAVVLDPKLDDIGEGNSGSYFLVTPNVEIPEDAQLRFRSKYDQLGDENTTYKIMISTAPQPDIEDFIDLDSWTGDDIEEEQVYNMRVIDLPSGISPGVEIYIAFVVENTQPTADVSGAAWTVDDVNLISACPLVNPDEVSVDEITVNSATIYWTHPLATDFEIQIVEEGEDIDEEAGETVNTQMFEAENLEEDTSYDVYLKSICPNDNEGVWQYVINFQTDKYGMSCGAPIEIGDSYSFEGNINEFPNSADINFDSPGSNCLGDEVTDNYINGNQIYFSYTAQEDGMINISQMTLPFTPGTGCFGNSQSAVFVYDGCDAVGEECIAALRTTNVDQVENINNFPVEEGQTYIIVISTIHDAPDSSVCFEFNFDFLTCPSPTEISYESLLQNSVIFSWDNPLGLGDEWEYAVVPEGQGEPAGSGTVTSENEDVLIDGLDGNTTYDFYVRSICGTDPSQWSQPYTFSTQCEVYDLPYFSSLATSDSEFDLECWSELNANEDSTKWLFEFNYARFPINSSFEGENDDYLVTPQVNLSGESTKQIRFDYDSYGGPVTVSILVSSTGVGADDFDQTILEETIFDETGWDTFFERIVVIPEGISGVVNIAFHIGSTDPSATAFFVKNVNIEEMPACSAPLDPWVDEVSVTTADIGWTPGYQETQWEVFVSAISDPAPEEEDSGVLVDTNEYTLEDLDPGTQYNYYVRAYCNEEDQSVWVGPVVFNTTCNTVGLEVPYEESFNDSDPDTHKFCWTILNEGGNEMVALQMLEESILMQTPMFGPAPSFDEWLISPAIELEDGTYDIQFDYRAIGSPFSPTGYGGLEVLMSTTDLDPESFTEIEPLFSFSNSNYQTKSIFYEQEGLETVYIAIRVPPTAGVSSLEVDDFNIDLLTECPVPNDLTVGNVTANTVDVSWEAGFQEDEWDLVVQPAETGLPPADMEVVSQSSLTVQDLDPLTDYEVYVRAKCGEPMGNSEWVGPVSFTTHCDAVYDTPFIETFEETSESRECWLVVNDNNDGNFWHLGSALNPYEGELSAGIFTGTNGANNDWLISPTINVTDGQRIRFFHAVMDGFFIEDLKVFVSTDGVNLSDFTIELFDTGENTINNEAYKEMVLNLPDGIAGEVNIAFQVPQVFSTAPYRGQSLFIDNVVVEDIPDCPNPINPEFVTIQDANATISWDVTGEEDTWEVAVIPENEVEDPNNIDWDSIDVDYIHETQDMPYEIEGLDPSQRYYVAVRAICSEESNSGWSEVIELITVCDLDDQCEYTITLISGTHTGVGGGIDVIQNEQVIQTLEFPTGGYADGAPDPEDFIVYFCNGVEFSLFWDSVGTVPGQYPDSSVEVRDADGNLVFDSEGGIGEPRSVIYTGVPACGAIDCPQPDNISVDENMEFTWDVNGDEEQWEVAITPVDDGTLPMSGTVIDVPNYTPTVADFIDPSKMTYDFFVRAICAEDAESYWSGPYSFVRGDVPGNAITAPVNDQELCFDFAGDVSFRHSNMSAEEMTCDAENTADVWLEFTATSRVHNIEVNGFTGNFYTDSGDELYPDMTTTLYKEEGDGSLTEMRCSENNVIVAAYANELEIGETYKIRLTLNNAELNSRLFNVCITTPEDLCEIGTVNGSFERPMLSYFSGISSILFQEVVSGWRKNMDDEHGDAIFIWEGLNAAGMGMEPYAGNQFVQIVADPDQSNYDPEDPRGIYTDMETSEISVIDYSYATSARGDNNTIQLYAGPVGGPYTMVREDLGLIQEWTKHTGSYEVPEDQDETRFIFVPKNYEIGNLLDDVNFVANNEVISEDATLGCLAEEFELEANGYGQWSADVDNPGEVEFEDSENRETVVSSFTNPGEYVFYWTTRYCEESITVTYEGLEEVPQVESPIEYCLNEEAEPLMAEPMEGYDLVFFMEEGGEAYETITPETSELGSTIYYVAYESEEGCRGPLVELEVIINDDIEESPIVDSPVEYCLNEEAMPLTAEESEEYSLVFFEEENGEPYETITPDTSEPGTFIYYAAYQSEGGCMSELIEIEVIINEPEMPEVRFYYDDYVYCPEGENPTPLLEEGFAVGGQFSATPAGISINEEDGTIDLENSEAGVYDISYTIESSIGNCYLEGVYTTDVEIMPEIEFQLESYCQGASLMISPIFPNEDDQIGVDYVWQDDDGMVVGNDQSLDFSNTMGAENLPATVYLTVQTNECSFTRMITIENVFCKIPEGISPNGDGINDSFNLTGMGVKHINIYNRYGTKVFNKDNYTDEWEGQSNNGDALPSGTYYYVIKTTSRETIKGWVYVNREY